MTNRLPAFLIFFSILILLTALTISFSAYSHAPKTDEIEIRRSFTSVTGLPDLSVFLEDTSARHRSLSDTASDFISAPFAPDVRFSGLVYSSRRSR